MRWEFISRVSHELRTPLTQIRMFAETLLPDRARLDEAAVASLDDDAMRQVLLNLLDNTVKYGPSGQRVLVGVERRGAHVRVWVQDEGPGVPPADRERIWERFERLERDRARAWRPDLFLLDLMLPGMDGFRLLRSLREEGIAAPILILTARKAGYRLKR